VYQQHSFIRLFLFLNVLETQNITFAGVCEDKTT
jgi:hypothetical protein